MSKMLNIGPTDNSKLKNDSKPLSSSRSVGHNTPQGVSSPAGNNVISEKRVFSDTKAKTPMAVGSGLSFGNNQSNFSPEKANVVASSSPTNLSSRINHSPTTELFAGRENSKSQNICINLITVEDADTEEFNDLHGNASQLDMKGGNTPIKSPKKKSMIGITETHTPLLKISKSNEVSESESNKTEDSLSSLGDVDESILEQIEGMGDNFEKITNMTLIHNFNVRFEQNRVRVSSLKKKTKPETQALSNAIIVDLLIDFLECGDLINLSRVTHFMRNDARYKIRVQQRLRKLILKGLSDKEQYSFWNALIKFKDLKHDHETAFTQNFVRKCVYIKDIKKDLDRTLPEHDKYSTEEGKNALLKVLVAVSNSIKDVGYIQGLNSIAGVFLFYLKEEQAFWATLYLLEKLKVKDLLKDNFQAIHLLNYQFKSFLENYLPEIAEHLKFQVITLEYITTPWFITLFSYFLPLSKVLKLWNFFFLKGVAVFIQFGLAIFSHYKQDILQLEPDEVPFFLKNELRNIEDDNDILFEKALQFKVTRRLMAELAIFYNKGKPKVQLYKDENDQQKWQIVPLNLTSATNISTEKLTPKESPFQFQKLLNVITVGIPDTFKNMFARNKTLKNEPDLLPLPKHPEEVNNVKEEKNQPASPLNQNGALTMEREEEEEDSVGVVYVLESSPAENLKTQEIMPDGYLETYQDNYTISDKGMLYTDTEVNDLMFVTKTEPNDPQKRSISFSGEIKKGAATTRTNLVRNEKESPGKKPLTSIPEIGSTIINRTEQDLDRGFIESIPKLNSEPNTDRSINNSRLLTDQHNTNNNNNQSCTSRPLAM